MRLLPLLVLLAACSRGAPLPTPTPSPTSEHSSATKERTDGQGTPRAEPVASGQAEAVFAGGCFWCMETAFEGVPGVVSATSGYSGGDEPGPTYEEVSSGQTGHFEAVRVVYDPARISYTALVDIFVRNVDPTQSNGQFCDHGRQYRSAIFVASEAERAIAVAALERARRRLDADIATTVIDAKTFWVAEDYHQDFYRTHPARYTSYREGCGRDARLRELWGADAPAH